MASYQVVSRLMTLPKMSRLILGTCGYVTSHSKKGFADVIQLRTLKPGAALD